MREYLVIEDSRANCVFAPKILSPTYYFPRDVAEELLGRKLTGHRNWFTKDESKLMHDHPEYTEVLPE